MGETKTYSISKATLFCVTIYIYIYYLRYIYYLIIGYIYVLPKLPIIPYNIYVYIYIYIYILPKICFDIIIKMTGRN